LDISEVPDKYIGTDESGKGDYFGPLVIAGVYVDPLIQTRLESLNILESKRISDNRAVQLAEAIRQIAPSSLVIIGPEKYNQLYAKIKNLNRLLGWGHARAIENILAQTDCDTAISDQFGDERFICNSLMKKGSEIRLLQTPGAERFLAVSAASVLARAAFLNYLKKLESEYQMELPKGASGLVDQAGRRFLKAHGVKKLDQVAKMHFKTTKKIGAV
jgi:ribonuclease HIII